MLTGAERLVDLVPLLEQHPDLDVVIDHMASCSPDAPEKLELLLNLAQFPRVYVKISHTWSISKTGTRGRIPLNRLRRFIRRLGVRD